MAAQAFASCACGVAYDSTWGFLITSRRHQIRR